MVTDDLAEAERALAAGDGVVLIVPEDAPTISPSPRLAVMIGDPANPAVRRAAEEMDGELFGRLDRLD